MFDDSLQGGRKSTKLILLFVLLYVELYHDPSLRRVSYTWIYIMLSKSTARGRGPSKIPVSWKGDDTTVVAFRGARRTRRNAALQEFN